MVIRTAWVNDVAPDSRSFAMQVINSLQNGDVFKAAIDQFGHPTYSLNLAEIIIELIKNNFKKTLSDINPSLGDF